MIFSVWVHVYIYACAQAQSVQLCLTLCDPMSCSLPGSSVHGILQARTLEWVAMPPPRNLLDPGIKPASPPSPALQVDSLLLNRQGSLCTFIKQLITYYIYIQWNSVAITSTALAEFLILGTSL